MVPILFKKRAKPDVVESQEPKAIKPREAPP
jgi:hypothetical protein